MTVHELIENLSKIDPELNVLVDGYEMGLDRPTMVVVVPVVESGYEVWWAGGFEPKKNGVPTVYIGRGRNVDRGLLKEATQ